MNNTKADYKNIEKEVLKMSETRNNNKAKVEKEISEQKASIDQAKKIKQKALETGTKEEYLRACENLVKEENSLEYLEEKAKQLTNNSKVSFEDLKRVKRTIKAEQDRTTKEGLKQLKGIFEDFEKLRSEILEEQRRGDSIYSNLLNMFKEDATPGEMNALTCNMELCSEHYSSIYGINLVSSLEREVNGLRNALNKTAISEFIGK